MAWICLLLNDGSKIHRKRYSTVLINIAREVKSRDYREISRYMQTCSAKLTYKMIRNKRIVWILKNVRKSFSPAIEIIPSEKHVLGHEMGNHRTERQLPILGNTYKKLYLPPGNENQPCGALPGQLKCDLEEREITLWQ